MKRAPSLDDFIADPVGKWIVAGSSSIAWCVSASIGGATTWGRPDVDATRAVVRAFDALRSDRIDRQVDVILDARRVDSVSPDSLSTLIEWILEHREFMQERVRLQIGVVPRGIAGITLAGVLPTLGQTHPFRVEHESVDAFRVLVGDNAEAVSSEIDAIVEGVSGVPAELVALRDVIRERHASLSIEEAARTLSLSTRSLQRSLKACGTSFVDEVRAARLAEAEELLRSSDYKVSAVANRVGITEGALTELFREKLGCTPNEYRKNASDRSGD